MMKSTGDAIEDDIEDILGAGNLTHTKERVESDQEFKSALQATNVIAQAIKTGNLGMLRKWVKRGNQFKRTWYDLTDGNNSALRLAVDWGQIEVVKWLVEVCKQPICSMAKSNQGICAPHGTDDKFDAAWLAVRKNNYSLAKWLIDH